MANNTFKSQNLFAKSVEFMWEAQDGMLAHVDFQSGKFDPANNTGETVNLRRPGQLDAQVTAMGGDYSLPGGAFSATYQTMVEPSLPLTIDVRAEITIQASVEDMLTKIDKKQVMDRFIRPGLAAVRTKFESALISKVATTIGQQIGVPSGSTGAQWLTNAYEAQAQLSLRGVDLSNGTALIHPSQLAKLATGQATIFKASEAATSTYSNGKLGKYAGFDWYTSPYLKSNTFAAASGTITGGTAARPTVWTPTWTATLSTSAVDVGSRIQLSGVNFCHPLTKEDTGIPYTAVVQAITAGGVATLSEPLVATGAYKNVTADIVPGTTTFTVINAGTGTKASYLWDGSAIVGASPDVKLGKDVRDSAVFVDLGGIKAAIVTQTWPGTIQEVTKIIAFGGFAIPRPEAMIALY